MMRVFYTFFNADDQQVLADWNSACDPPAYRERIGRMASRDARTRTRAGLWLLQQLLIEAGYSGNTLERIGFSASGQPQIVGAPAFSISHSDTLVACALCDTARIGLDVEHRRLRDMSRMARLLEGEERRHVEQTPMSFFDYWCAREATVKASGRVGLKRIRAIKLDAERAILDGHDWCLTPIKLHRDYAGCLASDRPPGPIDRRELSVPGSENTDPQKSSDQ